jgi:hypothetical protein
VARVMIRCPQTQEPIPTGMSMDEQSFESATLSQNSVQCPQCGQMHTWDKEDAWLED